MLDIATVRNGAHTPVTQPVTVLIAVGPAEVREALVAMLGALDGFVVVGEAANDEQALALARDTRPQLALVDQELSGCRGWWTIQTLRREGLVEAVVALGRRGNGLAAELAGAQAYVQMGTPPRDLLVALQAAVSH